MTLGERIAYYRGKLGLSQGELAERLGVSRQAVSKWETDAGLPDLERLIALSRLYRITLDELVKGESPEETAEAPEEIPVDAVIAKPAAPSGQKTIGYILLGVGLLCAALALVLNLALLIPAVYFLICAVLCLTLRRYAGRIINRRDAAGNPAARAALVWRCKTGERDQPDCLPVGVFRNWAIDLLGIVGGSYLVCGAGPAAHPLAEIHPAGTGVDSGIGAAWLAGPAVAGAGRCRSRQLVLSGGLRPYQSAGGGCGAADGPGHLPGPTGEKERINTKIEKSRSQKERLFGLF